MSNRKQQAELNGINQLLSDPEKLKARLLFSNHGRAKEVETPIRLKLEPWEIYIAEIS